MGAYNAKLDFGGRRLCDCVDRTDLWGGPRRRTRRRYVARDDDRSRSDPPEFGHERAEFRRRGSGQRRTGRNVVGPDGEDDHVGSRSSDPFRDVVGEIGLVAVEVEGGRGPDGVSTVTLVLGIAAANRFPVPGTDEVDLRPACREGSKQRSPYDSANDVSESPSGMTRTVRLHVPEVLGAVFGATGVRFVEVAAPASVVAVSPVHATTDQSTAATRTRDRLVDDWRGAAHRRTSRESGHGVVDLMNTA